MTAPDNKPADGICARCGRDHELDAVVNEHISELLENEPADDIPTTDPYTGQDMRFGASSLEAILHDYAEGLHDYSNGKGKPDDYRIKTAEALAAIAAYYEGLIPEKDTADYPGGTARKAMQIGRNTTIDAIRRNFKGGRSWA